MRRFRNHRGPAESVPLVPHPTNSRLAQSHQPVSRGPIDRSMYPAADVDPLAPSIHDIPLVQGLFDNDSNFCSSTSCEVFEIGIHGRENVIGSCRTIAGDTEMDHFVRVSTISAFHTLLLAFSRHSARWQACETKLNSSDSLSINRVNQA